MTAALPADTPATATLADPTCCGSADAAPVGLTEADAELALLAKALGHPVRVLILRNLMKIGTCYFGRLADLLPVAASTASQHLTILKEAGLVRGDISDQRPCYCVDAARLQRLRHLVGDL